MPFELESLVGHLYIMGKRVLKTTPPGVLVEVAPSKAARGREADTFFALVLPSGTVAPNTFYEQMAQMAAERFFNIGGSVTAALRDVLNTLNNNLFEHNQSGRTHYEANMLCAVLRGEEITIARVGAAAAVIQAGDQTVTYPEDLTADEALFQPPLGVQPVPAVFLKRFPIEAGARFVLSDASLAEIPLAKIEQALRAGNLEEALSEFKLLVTLQIQLIAVELVRAEEPVPMPVVMGESTTAIAAELSAMRQNTLPQTATAELPRSRARPNRTPAVVEESKKVVGNAADSAGRSMLALGEVAGKLFARPIDTPPTRPRFTSRFLMAAVIGFPALVVMIVVFSWVTHIGETEFEVCVNESLKDATFARTVDSSAPPSVIAAWQGTIDGVDECLRLRPQDPTLLAIKQEGQRILDQVKDISRRSAIPIATLLDAEIGRLVLQGLDLYALDTKGQIVYRIQVGADGVSAGTAQPIPSMRQGTTVDGLTIGPLFDIAFDDQQRGAIVALDTNGTLVRCQPSFIMECDAQRLLNAENWKSPQRISLWQGRLYLLDPMGNQIWRYQATGEQYASSPTEYFVETVRPNLANAVDFDITTTGIGKLFVLYADGFMSSHISGETQQVALADFPEGETLSDMSVQSMFLNDGPINKTFLIVSQAAHTVYETTHTGTLIARYRVAQEDQFELLTQVVMDPSTRIMYAASGNTIFAIKMDG